MRYFKCFDCEHNWKIVFWEDGKDTKMACPECKSLNVHQIEKVRGWDREGKYTSLANDEDHTPPRKPAINNLTPMTRTTLNQGKLNGFIERFVKHSP